MTAAICMKDNSDATIALAPQSTGNHGHRLPRCTLNGTAGSSRLPLPISTRRREEDCTSEFCAHLIRATHRLHVSGARGVLRSQRLFHDAIEEGGRADCQMTVRAMLLLIPACSASIAPARSLPDAGTGCHLQKGCMGDPAADATDGATNS